MKHLFILTLVQLTFVVANAQISERLQKKIVSQGVPAKALKDVSQFLYENKNRSFQQSTYTCEGKPETYLRPCIESKRIATQSTVTLGSPRYVSIVDFKKPSSQRRFYLIDLRNGEVQSYYSSHGIGTGRGDIATRFSNRKDSRMTSLGMYLTGEIYNGGYGKTLRMYGLEKSNDRGYDRDIVLHGAWYVSEDFMKMINPKTKEPYQRIGVSWGCPAVSTAVAKKIIPLLQQGSLIYHYHEDLMEAARTGREISIKSSPASTAPKAKVAPKKSEASAPKKEKSKEVKIEDKKEIIEDQKIESKSESIEVGSEKTGSSDQSETSSDQELDGPDAEKPHDSGEDEEL